MLRMATALTRYKKSASSPSNKFFYLSSAIIA